MVSISYATYLYSLVESASTYYIVSIIGGTYLLLLLSMNLIPHVRVRSLGWLSLRGVKVTLPDATITARRIQLSFGVPWRSAKPFRIIHLSLLGVVVIKKGVAGGRRSETETRVPKNASATEAISFLIPKLVSDIIFKGSWLNELSVHISQISFYHHAMDKNVSLHFAYVKMENLSNPEHATTELALSILDGYINDRSKGSELSRLKLFHILEISVKSDLIFSCLPRDTNRLKMDLFNFEILIVLTELRVRKLAKILEKRKVASGGSDKPQLPSLQCFLSKLNMITSVQLKLEQSEIDFKELKLQSSSYSLNYNRDVSSKQQTTAKISTYVTAARISHLGSKCIEIPSITYIFSIDISDFYRAMKSDNKDDFTVDLFTTLSMTNPSFIIYFDQLAFLLDSFSAGGSHDKSEKRTFPKHVLAYTKHIKRSSVKVMVVDWKAQLHLPHVEREDFSRESTQNLISNAGAQVLGFKFSSKNLGNLFAKKCSGSAPVALKSFLKLRNVFMEVEENRINLSSLGIVTAYCLNTHKIALRIKTKRVQLKSVNTMIFHVIRRVREAKILSVNRACAKMHSEEKIHTDSQLSEETTREFLDLFNVLPVIIHSIRFRSTFFYSYIVCNDWLPSHVIHDEKSNEDVDLADFKRGVSFLVTGLELDYKRQEEIFEARLRQVQACTLSEYTSEYADEDLKKHTDPLEEELDTSSVESGLSGCSSFDSEDDVETVKKVLNVEDIVLRNPKGNRKKLIFSIPEIEGRVDMYLAWCMIYAYTLVEIISPRVEQTYTQEQEKQLTRASTIIDLDVEIASLSVVARLPHDVDILFEIDNLHLRKAVISPHCKVSYVRLYVVHSTTRLWSRLVSVTDIDVDFDMVSRNSINLKSKAFRFNIPFQFLVYTVIDNAITFGKAIKQVWDNFKHLSTNINDYAKVEPVACDALKVPHIELRSDVMGITLENDAFESELALIFQYGAVENVERNRKLAAFEKKAEELRAHTRESLSRASVESRRFIRRQTERQKSHVLVKALFNHNGSRDSTPAPKRSREMVSGSTDEVDQESGLSPPKPSRLKRAFSGCDTRRRNGDRSLSLSPADTENSTNVSFQNTSDDSDTFNGLTEEETEALIAQARALLLEDISNSWVGKFEKYKHSYNASWKRRMEKIWGPDSINKAMKSKFDIQEYSRGPPQFQGVLTNLDLIVDDPQLDDVHEFLRKHGKGQPRLEYSILVPAYLHLRCSSLYMSLRDYSLPFISFPKSGNPEAPVMNLKGTIVINEKLFVIPEELRNIFVPLSPAIKTSEIVDNFYSVKVVRTLTPVKMMFDLESTLTTDRSCIISWCKSYQPALSSAMMAFENFTKPEIDDSLLGWWDKVSLIAHGKINFFIKNELCLHMKSSISPYDLVGNSSGLVFCWKNNVRLRMNDSGKRSELVILQSDDFILGIPNYSANEGKAWSLMNTTSEDIVHEEDEGEAESNKFQKRIMKLTSDEKVTWKLGFLFERNVDVNAKELSADMERTDQFKPHYDVTVTGPQYEYHPDSYTEFRSDYTHLAIGVNSSSVKGNSRNYVYLTPLTLEYFKVWWNTLLDDVSLPIREGKLFAKSAFNESSVKFGPHLFSLKYQIVLEPITVSDMYLSSSGKDSNHKVVTYGIKGKADRCAIDLHQRREIARYVNEKLGINKKVRQLKMNLGEVEVSEADIRLVFAQFDDVSMMGKLLSFYSGETKHQVDIDTYEAEMKRHNARNKATPSGLIANESDYPWIDSDDFIEMEENEILSPNITLKVIPFANTPSFTYFREFTLENPDGLHPFGHEPSHECLIGANSPEEIQTQLVELRATEVRVKLNNAIKKSQKLDPNTDSKHAHARKRHQLENEIIHWQDKVNYLESMLDESTSNHANVNVCSSKVTSRRGSMNEVKPQISRTLSAYTITSSSDQAHDMVSEDSVLSEYHNRFLIHNLRMKWNNQVRDVFTSFLSVIGQRQNEELSMSRTALDLMDKLLRGTEQKKKQTQREPSFVSEHQYTCGNDVIEAFDQYLTNLDTDSEEIGYKYIVKFIKPQIHFQSDINPEAIVLMTSDDIELRVFSVNHEGTDDIVTSSGEDSSLLETRYGVLCKDSRVWAFQQEEFSAKSSSKDSQSLRSGSNDWCPWLNLEDGVDLELNEKNLVFEKTTIAFSFKKPNMLSMENINDTPRKSEVVLHMAKLVINATSAQYSAFYYVLTDLLVHGNQKNYFLQRIEQISSVSEASDFVNLAEKVKVLQNNIRITKFVILKMNGKSLKLSEQKRREYNHVKFELCRMKIELHIIIKSLEAKSSKITGTNTMCRVWTFHVDQLIFHILDNSRKPFVDLALATSKFTRYEEADGSNANSVSVSLIQGFNLREGIVYPEIIQPYVSSEKEKRKEDAYDNGKPMILMNWKMLTPVGGIRVMKNAELSVQPLKIQLDYDTATDLFSYLFPKDDDKAKKGHTSPNSKTDESYSDDYGSDFAYDADENPVTSNSPSKAFKKIWNSRVSSHSDSSSSHTHYSSNDSVSKDTTSMTSTVNTRSPDQQKGCRRKHRKNATETSSLADDINVIMNRSAQYFVVGEFLVKQMKLCVSVKAPGYLNIIDVHNLVFSIPSIHYKDKTWTSNDFVDQLQKDIIKIFLSNTGKIIGNKFRIKNRKRMTTPLRQISDFSSYVALEDLQEDSASLWQSEAAQKSNLSRISSNEPSSLTPRTK